MLVLTAQAEAARCAAGRNNGTCGWAPFAGAAGNPQSVESPLLGPFADHPSLTMEGGGPAGGDRRRKKHRQRVTATFLAGHAHIFGDAPPHA
jgi:hypothetical protein